MVRTVVVLVVSLIGLAACGGEDPTADPTPIQASSSSVSSPTASESESAEPEVELWQQKSRAGAKAFVDHWAAVWSEAVVTGELDEFRSISHPKCFVCNSYLDDAEKVYGDGGHVESEPWRVLRKWYDHRQPLESPRVTADMITPRTVVIWNAEGKREVIPQERTRYTAALRWSASGWRMFELEYIA